VIVLAGCAVYDVPSDLVDPGGEGGSAGSSPATAGKSSGGGAPGGQPTAGSSTSGSGAVTSGSGGSEPLDPPAGGEGGAAPDADTCPDDPNKLAPGACGCGFPDENTATLADCRDIEAALVHRYDFEGTGTAVMDRAGTAHGEIIGGAMLSQLEGHGVLELGGGTAGPYVDLPNGILSQLTDASIEAWVTWRGGNNWQRLFDFGDSTSAMPENNPANGKSYLYMSPKSGDGFALTGYSLQGNSMGQELRVASAAALATSVLSHVLVVANSAAAKLTLYINGEKSAEQPWTGQLSSINDVNVWLGRSQYSGDHELNGVFHDFRIYDAPLSDLQVATCFAAGPDPAFLAD
jgi:hypothetical protein